MSDAADRLAEAIRDLVNETVQVAVAKSAAATPRASPPPPPPKPEEITDEVRRIYVEKYGEQPVPARHLLDIPEAMERLGGIGRSTFYKLVGQGHIRTFKIGRRTFVLASALDKFIDGDGR
jgi:excisionase family DNA binding protein